MSFKDNRFSIFTIHLSEIKLNHCRESGTNIQIHTHKGKDSANSVNLMQCDD